MLKCLKMKIKKKGILLIILKTHFCCKTWTKIYSITSKYKLKKNHFKRRIRNRCTCKKAQIFTTDSMTDRCTLVVLLFKHLYLCDVKLSHHFIFFITDAFMQVQYEDSSCQTYHTEPNMMHKSICAFN